MKKIIVSLAIIVALGWTTHAADNFVRGYTFDGATGLVSGAHLEDLVTESYPTWESTQTNNALRMVDGVTIGGIYQAIGSTWWTWGVMTNSITSGHIKDGTITSNDLSDTLWNDLDDQYGRKTEDYAMAESQSPTTGTLTLAPTVGWTIATNALTTENYDTKASMSNGKFVAPYAGMYTFTIMFYGYFPNPLFTTNTTTIMCGIVRDQSPYNNVDFTTPSAEDTYFSGVGQPIGGGDAANAVGTYGSLGITFSRTIPLGAGVQVFPAFYLYSTYPGNIAFGYVPTPDFGSAAVQAWFQFAASEVSKGTP